MPTPKTLRDAIERDLKRARPLRRPATRALALAPIAAAILVGVPLLHAFRGDMRVIGFVRAWGFSIAQTIAGLVVIALALRESIPGRALSTGTVTTTVVGGLALPMCLVVLTSSRFDVGPGPGLALVEGAACFKTSALAAVPAIIVAAILAARAFPLRPGIAGGLYGLGAGLMADAGLRLYCDYSVPSHVLFAHGGAVAASMVAGAFVATAVARRPIFRS
ncbi:MAG TPA: NrsF family protein [Vicinamibacterales bacterium]|jgi:hypothetical protein|nr:NrsF family protein [Vicinamibacterales bacterium]